MDFDDFESEAKYGEPTNGDGEDKNQTITTTYESFVNAKREETLEKKHRDNSVYKYNYGKTLATVNDENGDFYVAKVVLNKLNEKGKEVTKTFKFIIKCESINAAETIINENMPAYMDRSDDTWDGWLVESISLAKIEMVFD